MTFCSIHISLSATMSSIKQKMGTLLFCHAPLSSPYPVLCLQYSISAGKNQILHLMCRVPLISPPFPTVFWHRAIGGDLLMVLVERFTGNVSDTPQISQKGHHNAYTLYHSYSSTYHIYTILFYRRTGDILLQSLWLSYFFISASCSVCLRLHLCREL